MKQILKSRFRSIQKYGTDAHPYAAQCPRIPAGQPGAGGCEPGGHVVDKPQDSLVKPKPGGKERPAINLHPVGSSKDKPSATDTSGGGKGNQTAPSIVEMKKRLEAVGRFDDEKTATIKKELSEPVSSKDKLGGGVNGSYLVLNETGRMGVFKPAHEEARRDDGSSPKVGLPLGTAYKREAAASTVAQILGFGDLVPVTTEREVENSVGSIQDYVGDSQVAHAVSESRKWDGEEDAARSAVFDYLTGNMDRHAGNWLVRDVGGENKLALIDNGYSFPTKYDANDHNKPGFMVNAVHSNLDVPDLSSWKGKWEKVEEALKSHGIEDDAIKLTKQRFETLANHKDWGFDKFGDLDNPFTGGSMEDHPKYIYGYGYEDPRVKPIRSSLGKNNDSNCSYS